MRRLFTAIRRSIAAALHTDRALRYTALSGQHAADLATGKLVRAGDYLAAVGGGDLPDGQQSWYGRHVAKAYRKTHGTEPLRAWVQHRTTGRWIHAFIYQPDEPALAAGLQSYKGTRHLAAALLAEAA